ncbi:MAG TPA: hypothetical protein VF559_11770 [Caulobacteraceae bacterium]|jgi:hypothetical protein
MNEAAPYPPPKPASDPDHQLEANAAQLKADYDSGRTGDKVAVGDPAASPLGTDEEAGGAPLSGESIAQARAQETRPNAAASRDSSQVNNAQRNRLGGGAGVLLGLLAAAVVIGLIALVLFNR